MTPKEFEALLRKNRTALAKCVNRVLPVKLGQKAQSLFRKNFRDGGFFGSAWQETKREQSGGRDASSLYSPLTSSRNHLMSSVQYTPGNATVTIYNRVVYAALHNQGGTISSTVTPQMRKFAWAKFYESGGGKKVSAATNEESEMWKRLALTSKSKLSIRIPQRKFMGSHPYLKQELQDIIITEINKILK